MLCASAHCTNSLSLASVTMRDSNKTGLCGGCSAILSKHALPIGGFIPSPALRSLAKLVIAKTNPTQAEISEAIRHARGPSYPNGPWDKRPAYRVNPLVHGRATRRLPHILLGRRKAPTEVTIAASYIHAALARSVIGTGPRYQRFLAGASFYGRRGVCPPKGRKEEVFHGGRKGIGYRLSSTDFAMLGTHALRSANKLGLTLKDRFLLEFIMVTYQRGVSDGLYHPPVSVPRHAIKTCQAGDHPLDHFLADNSGVPSQYLRKNRRASGLIGGQWPVGIDPLDELLRHNDAPRSVPPAEALPVKTPDTRWIWASKA